MQNDLGVVATFIEITARQFLLFASGAEIDGAMNFFCCVITEIISVLPIRSTLASAISVIVRRNHSIFRFRKGVEGKVVRNYILILFHCLFPPLCKES
jgi:hypothetical protein